MEAAIDEQLRRSGKVRLHERLVHAPLIYDRAASKIMGMLYKEYMDLAQKASLPILICTPTWRANKDRVYESNVSNAINVDAVSYMQRLRDSRNQHGNIVKIGGLIGCKNDCYRPEEGLSVLDAQYLEILS